MWLSSVLIGYLSSNSKAIVTGAQTALSSNYCFKKKRLPIENPRKNHRRKN